MELLDNIWVLETHFNCLLQSFWSPFWIKVVKWSNYELMNSLTFQLECCSFLSWLDQLLKLVLFSLQRNDKALSDSKSSVRNFSTNYRESMSTSSTTTTPTLNHSITTFYDQVSFDVEIDEEDDNGSEQQHCSLVRFLTLKSQ